jgi:hypothetical protein
MRASDDLFFDSVYFKNRGSSPCSKRSISHAVHGPSDEALIMNEPIVMDK